MKVWFESGVQPRQELVADCVAVSATVRQVESPHELKADEISIISVNGRRPVIGVMIVPRDFSSGAILLNYRPVDPGPLELRTRDKLRCRNVTIWVSSTAHIQTYTYSPEELGAEVYCARSRIRLQPGQTIVVCECGMLFSHDAWQLQIPCPNCRFDPTKTDWEPPVMVTEKKRFSELLPKAERPMSPDSVAEHA